MYSVMMDLTNALRGQNRYSYRDMAMTREMTRCVGFVVHAGRPVGTCFLIRVQSEMRPGDESWDHGYLVTARHCVPPDSVQLEKDPAEVWMPNADGLLVKGYRPSWWYREDDEDVAIAAWVPSTDPTVWQGFPFYGGTVVGSGSNILLGSEVLYVGLLDPVRSMRDRGQPMVRVANLGATNVAIDWDNGKSRAKEAHLIDCRSRAGFSGSPCFAHTAHPGMLQGVLPPEAADQAAAFKLGSTYHFHQLMGMLVAFGDEAGLGIVLPLDRIREMLAWDDLVKMRRQHDEQREQTESTAENGIESIAVTTGDADTEPHSALTGRPGPGPA